MFLPIGDTPNPTGWNAWTNWALIAANVAVYGLFTWPASQTGVSADDPLLLAYLNALGLDAAHVAASQLASLSQWDLLVFAHGYKPGAPDVADLFSSMFMHAGFLHLAGNMLFLWIYGDNIEHRLGRFTYLVVYLACGAAATLAFAAVEHPSMVPLVGASGAISGVLGAYFLLFGHNQVKVLVALLPFILDVYLIGARWVLGVFLVLDNLAPLLFGAESHVAYGAHLGGFAFGLGVAWAGDRLGWSLRRAPSPEARGVRRARPADRKETVPALRRAAEQVRLGDRTGAHRTLRGALRRAHGADRARLHLALGELELRYGQPTTAFQHLHDAIDLDPSGSGADKARRLLASIDVYKRRAR